MGSEINKQPSIVISEVSNSYVYSGEVYELPDESEILKKQEEARRKSE